MTLAQLSGLRMIDQDVTDEAHGTYHDQRSVEQLLEYGMVLLDKPPGPTSHEAVAWAKRILEIPKAGHSGTLDPQVSGVLPLGLGEATKALGVLLIGPKEYIAVGRFHALQDSKKLGELARLFTGPIHQKPPQRSSVLRRTRVKTIHEIEVLEQKERLVLMRVSCEAGTYIRKLLYDMGEVVGTGASMIELRRTRVDHFTEGSGLVTMHELAEAYAVWKEGDGSRLQKIIRPVEEALAGIKAVVIRDSAVDALCHGAQLAIPGILQVSDNLRVGDIAGVYTQKGEVVALAEAEMEADAIADATKGHAFKTKRLIMKAGTYPKSWHSKGTYKEKE